MILSAGARGPVAVSVNVPPVPTMKIVLSGLVIAGTWLTVSVKFCELAAPTLLVAVNVNVYVPAVPAAGVPSSSPVAGSNVTPLGSVPATLKAGFGGAVAVRGG